MAAMAEIEYRRKHAEEAAARHRLVRSARRPRRWLRRPVAPVTGPEAAGA